jgi:protein subunit release factor B
MADPKQRWALDEESLARDCDVEIHTGGGPGGQHRNKTQTAVRLRHRPSGVVVTATERRSLTANRRAAFARLRERLLSLMAVRRPRERTLPTRGSVKRRLATKARTSRKKDDRRAPRSDD